MPTYGHDALYRHTTRVGGMLADPELVGELLLIGIAFARALDLNDPPLQDDNLRTGDVARAIYGSALHPPTIATFNYANTPRPATRGARRLHDVLRCDIRRYQPLDEYGRVTCGRPMAQRDTGRCGRHPSSSHVRRLTDPATGLREYVGACSYPAHRAWWKALREENTRQLAATKVPVPPANIGGALARHLDEIDWPGVYVALDPQWRPPPEVEAWTPPTLRLVVDAEEPEDATDDDYRPTFTVLEGGWR